MQFMRLIENIDIDYDRLRWESDRSWSRELEEKRSYQEGRFYLFWEGTVGRLNRLRPGTDTYIYQLQQELTELLGLKTECTQSIYHKGGICDHYDPHTPYRLNICLRSDPQWQWYWYDELKVKHNWHQPPNTTVLERAGDILHGVDGGYQVKPRHHIWYQWADILTEDQQNQILGWRITEREAQRDFS
jgi:hypothetical protein